MTAPVFPLQVRMIGSPVAHDGRRTDDDRACVVTRCGMQLGTGWTVAATAVRRRVCRRCRKLAQEGS